MRGRTFLNKYLIIDEAQNLTPKQMKTLITRAGPGAKARLPRATSRQIDTAPPGPKASRPSDLARWIALLALGASPAVTPSAEMRFKAGGPRRAEAL